MKRGERTDDTRIDVPLELRRRLEVCLADVTFPARKSVLLLHAGGANTVDPEIIQALKKVPELIYESLDEVEKVLRQGRAA
jgi:hypothetical protein